MMIHRLVLILLMVPLCLGRARSSLKEIKALMNQQVLSIGQCNFDKPNCGWAWNATNGTFIVARAPLPAKLAPTTDASGRSDGKFLYLSGEAEGQVRSKIILRAPGSSSCYLEVALHQVEMKKGTISLIIETFNRTSYVAAERFGNDEATWETMKFNLGGISQDFVIILELKLPQENSSIAVDNIRLVDCYHDTRIMPGNCTANQFSCGAKGGCLSMAHVCDLINDCADGEDENWECDKVPEYARCNFENGWCGWTNEKSRPLNWTLHQGPTATERMGPDADHTFGNATGTYAYVDMSRRVEYGSQGTLNSPIFNPMPPYHGDHSSPYYNSCKLRFFYHQFGLHTVALGLYMVQIKAHQNHSSRVWWSFKDNIDSWNPQVVSLPPSRYRYFLQFEANKGYASKGDVAIDDVSLSPECFGIGVPKDILGDWDYWNQKIPPWGVVPPKHADFTNETIISITTCGQTGRFGPTPEVCTDYRNETGGVEVLSPASSDEGDSFLRSKGIQRWIAPASGYYTIIATGARGGMGALAMGTTLGAKVRGVVDLQKGQQLYFMVGQPGTNACAKSLGSKNRTCQQPMIANSSIDYISIVRQVKNIELKDGGGGGGGATYVFTLKPNGQQQPLMVAGGGGGLGPTQFRDDGVQHARGRLPPGRSPVNGDSHKKGAGGGGGWLATSDSDNTTEAAHGKALTASGNPGIGGIGCGPNHMDHGFGDGGFGGGGGGCLSGGGGGGYAGGDTGHIESGNGEGGFSYISSDMFLVEYWEKANAGPGEVFIIPAVSGCGCDFRCVAMDQHLSDTQCVCNPGWRLGDDLRTCIASDYDEKFEIVKIILYLVIVCLAIASISFFILLYNKYQAKKAIRKRRQALFGNGTELTTLRLVSNTMLNEFNPNYEFPENLYSFKDLPKISRDSISLVKPIGQGAFGEVYQGIYRYTSQEESPVAIKTLPSTPTSAQSEADFMMEALIMSKFQHPNIVHFIGVSFDKHPRYIVLELLAGGDLKNFLREERPRPDRPTSLNMQDLIMLAFDVANGCKYMEDKRFIHRDIAARNCLLTSKGPGRVVKIADFGMARDIYRSDYYRKGGKAMLPIKWMPPESFMDGIFTTKTDVWAFGVLLWEIMSFGYMPYTGCHNREVMTMVTSGGRLEKPAGCPDPIYGIMTRCWHPHPDERPSFSTIVERIGYCLQDPDVINHPTPNFDILPICEREITIMRPDPDTECINAQAEVYKYLDERAYMQPRIGFRPSSYRIGPTGPTASGPHGIVYTSLLPEDHDNRNNIHKEQAENSSPREHFSKLDSPPEEHDLNDICDNREKICEEELNQDEPNANQTDNDELNVSVDETKSQLPGGHNGNGHESTTTTDTNSDSILIPSPETPPDTISSSSPNTRHCSPLHVAHDNGNGSPNNLNGIIKKSALKAALSLDPSALYSTKPCDKIGYISTKSKHNNPGDTEIRQDSLVNHELPREEECSC